MQEFTTRPACTKTLGAVPRLRYCLRAMGATHGHERPGRAQLDPDHIPPPPDALPARPTSQEESPGLIANRYHLLARIHASGVGTLYRAEDRALSRAVALRLLSPALSRDEAVYARLHARLQARAAMARDELGADIVELADLGRADNGQVFVVTEFLAGDNLASQLAREGPLPWQALRPLMVRACQIIHLSHQHGLLRLDLQTRHLFPIRDKTRTSTLKILSTGIGDVFGENLWSSLSATAAAAHIRYAAPEQVTGGNVDARTDVYALGVIMYELLSGQVPFPDARPAYLCARHLLEPAPRLTSDTAGPLPDAVAAIVGRALAKAPDDRWPTMRALANAMAAIEFGPCDASGVLELDDTLPVTPAASSASMRIDPTARHAPSPTVRPKTLPPLREAFLANPPSDRFTGPQRASEDRQSDAAVDRQVPEGSPDPRGSVVAAESARRDRPVSSASHEPGPSGSSSTMAWEEILAAADEAIAAVAEIDRTGTAGDSGVFIPERLLRSGAAATASMTRGRLSLDLVLQPRAPSRAKPASSGAAAASTTLQLDVADLADLEDAAGDSASELPTLARARRLERTSGDANASTLLRPTPTVDLHTSVTEVAAASHGSTDSALRAAIDRSAGWPRAARSRLVRSPASRLVWVATSLLLAGSVATAVLLLRSPEGPSVATPPPMAPPAPPLAARGETRPFQSAPPVDVPDETTSRPPSTKAPTQWPQLAADAGVKPPLTAAPPATPSPPTEPTPAVSPPPRVATTTSATRARLPEGAPPPLREATNRPPGAIPRPAPVPPPKTPLVAPLGPRKSSPGAQLPDAGHELTAPLEDAPLPAAAVPGKSE